MIQTHLLLLLAFVGFIFNVPGQIPPELRHLYQRIKDFENWLLTSRYFPTLMFDGSDLSESGVKVNLKINTYQDWKDLKEKIREENATNVSKILLGKLIFILDAEPETVRISINTDKETIILTGISEKDGGWEVVEYQE